MNYRYGRSLVGGTFDRFHLGHQKLLTTAFEQSEKVIIGIATDELFANKTFAGLIEDFKSRKKSVVDFLEKNDLAGRFEIVPILDFYGTTLEDANLDAIFITESNKENVLKINEERQKKEFKPLEIVIVPYVLGNDKEIISSERIRKGEIDREGNSYQKLFETQDKFVLPEDKREDLRRPIGPLEAEMKIVISNLPQNTILIAVGDIVAETLSELGRMADVSIIDGRTRREVLNHNSSTLFPDTTTYEASNPAGTITKNAAVIIRNAIATYETTHKRQLIVITGEEDLLAIPAVLLSPLDTTVVYGQFGQGIVVVKTTEQNKKRVQNLFGKFQ
ncbi:MAG TPA: pantetheine-phosphate adenylyltransferase [Candidatus Saccharimonadales bacterium]|nr:pantetheine-phosphate adenylyltransferase [Candidatus Saccharimonadales bacterium]